MGHIFVSLVWTRGIIGTVAFAALLGACSQATEVKPSSISSLKASEFETLHTPIPSSGQLAATNWLEQNAYDLDLIRALPLAERSARLNQAVYDFCEGGTASSPPDINDLFKNCKTACGGFSYVLRAMLEATGARTRYVNLLNIPQQGNHTGVEVRIDDDWAYFDPTFGAYFTENGTVDGRVLGLSEIASSTQKINLEDKVLQASNTRMDVINSPLETLYAETFQHAYMDLQNYQLPEFLSYGDPREMILLEVDVRLQDRRARIGNLEAADFQSLSNGWLADTNAILLNDDFTDDTSYNASMLWGRNRPSMTVVALDNATIGEGGLISLIFWNGAKTDVTLQIMPMGKTLSLRANRFATLPTGRSRLDIPYRAQERNARFALRNTEEAGVIYLFGIEVTPGLSTQK